MEFSDQPEDLKKYVLKNIIRKITMVYKHQRRK